MAEEKPTTGGVELSREDWQKALRDNIRQILADRSDPNSSSLTDDEADKIIKLARQND